MGTHNRSVQLSNVTLQEKKKMSENAPHLLQMFVGLYHCEQSSSHLEEGSNQPV